MKRTSVLLAAVLALVLAACGSDQTAESPSATPTVEPTPAATPTPTAAPETSEPTDDDDGSGSGFTGELSDALPETVGGLDLQPTPAGMDDLIGSMLQGQGVDAEDIDFAYGMWGQGELLVTAFRIEGMPDTQMALLAQAMSGMGGTADGGDVESEQATVGGKDVLRMTISGEGQTGTVYIYQSGDAFFSVVTEDEGLAEELLSQLP
jgi:hypothetical protein